MRTSFKVALYAVIACESAGTIYLSTPYALRAYSDHNAKTTIYYHQCDRHEKEEAKKCADNPQLCLLGKQIAKAWFGHNDHTPEEYWQSAYDRAERLGDTKAMKELEEHRPKIERADAESSKMSCVEEASLRCRKREARFFMLWHRIETTALTEVGARQCDVDEIKEAREACISACNSDLASREADIDHGLTSSMIGMQVLQATIGECSYVHFGNRSNDVDCFDLHKRMEVIIKDDMKKNAQTECDTCVKGCTPQ